MSQPDAIDDPRQPESNPSGDFSAGAAATEPPAPAGAAATPGSLGTNRDFRYLLGGAVFEGCGGQLAGFIIPIIAVASLGATEMQMGLLGAAESVAFLIIGLPAGAWVDRMRKRRILVVADLMRAVILVGLVLAFVTGAGSMWLLYGAALVMSATNVFFDVSHQSFVPAVVGLERIGEANSRLETVNSVTYIAGPGLAGLALRVIAAPLALAMTALTFVASAGLLARIRTRETLPTPAERQPLRTEIAAGLQWVVRHKLLRRIVACTSISNLFHAVQSAVVMIFMLRIVDLSKEQVGLVYSLGAAGALVGAACAGRVAKLVGEGRIIVLTAASNVVALSLTPLALLGAPLVWLIAANVLFTFSVVIYNVAQVSFRQRICPPALLGRMNASVRFIVWGSVPIGGVLGGFLGTYLGVVTTLWITVVGTVAAVVPVATSPLVTMRTLPQQ